MIGQLGGFYNLPHGVCMLFCCRSGIQYKVAAARLREQWA